MLFDDKQVELASQQEVLGFVDSIVDSMMENLKQIGLDFVFLRLALWFIDAFYQFSNNLFRRSI